MHGVARDPAAARRARADQIETLFGQWGRTTSSMILGGLILCVVMWSVVPHDELALWLTAILANQAWRYGLARRYRADGERTLTSERWGLAWTIGSGIAGALWGAAALLWFEPGDIGHQAVLIVCLFGVIMGGINLTSVHKPTLYAFSLLALAPLIVRVAWEADRVHAFIAAVLAVVLGFILRFGHNLNTLMAQSLAMRYENLDLVDALQAQTAEADRARASAEAANRGKTQFLAAASHDLRQPLHAMGLFAAALSARSHDAQVRHLVSSMNASVEALEKLFSALMDISKLDAGAIAPKRTAFALHPLFERLEREFAPLAGAKGLYFRAVPTRLWVESDPVLLERIVGNLASNAVRYTLRGGVVIGARRRASRVLVEAWDSGIGISSVETERIFEEFYQVAASGSRVGKGMGLGLAIIRRLSTLLEHSVRVRSQPGKGSCFSIELPRAAPVEPRPSATAEGHSPQAPLAGLCVAVVDDEEIVLQGMDALLGAWGAMVIGASSCDAMLAALGEAEAYPDLIIADYRIGQNELGPDVIARLRHELGVPTPALLISGDSSAATLDTLRRSGLDFLLKPVLPDELKVHVRRLCMSHSADPNGSRRHRDPLSAGCARLAVAQRRR